jgi:hypothetical protein
MNNMNASVTDDPERPEQHSLRRSVILHLLPGALVVTCYIIAAPQVVNLGFPPGLALLIGFVVVGIPLELGYLLDQGKKRNDTFSPLHRHPYALRWKHHRRTPVSRIVFEICLTLSVPPSTLSLMKVVADRRHDLTYGADDRLRSFLGNTVPAIGHEHLTSAT